MQRSLAFVLACAVLTIPVSGAQAVVPQTMSYQGVLADGNGNPVPDGLNNFTFKIYNVSSGGSALWTETQNNVQVTRGVVNVVLGSVTPITLAFDVPYWLGVSINADAELTPRVTLASSPYALSLRLPFTGSANAGANPALSINNTSSGPDIRVNDLLHVGSASSIGTMQVYRNGTEVVFTSSAGNGGSTYYYDEVHGIVGAIGPAFGTSTTGGAQILYANAAADPSEGIELDGNYNNTGEPRLVLTGSSQTATIRMDASGDASVALPASSISATEMLDEPGIAQNHVGLAVVPISSTTLAALTNILSSTITVPADGYVVALAGGTVALTGAARTVELQIDDASASSRDNSHYYIVGDPNAAAGSIPVTIQRTFGVVAGAHTYYLQGWNSGGSGSPGIQTPTITLEYFPTSYGAVNTVVSPVDAGAFDHAVPTSDGTGSIVDLRELELRAARRRAEADRAESELLRAQVRATAAAAQSGRPK